MKKKPNPHIPPYLRKRGGRIGISQRAQPSTPKPSQTSAEDTRRIVEQVVAEQITGLKRDLIREISQMTPQFDPSQLGEIIKEALGGLGGVVATQPSPQEQEVDGSEPLFIPSNITSSGNIQGNSVSVESVATEDNSLDSAAQALRAMRKKKGENK